MALDNPQLSPTPDAAVTPPAYPAASDISQLLGTDINKIPTFDYSRASKINVAPKTEAQAQQSLQDVQGLRQNYLQNQQQLAGLKAKGEAGINEYEAGAKFDWAKHQADEEKRITQDLEETKKQWSGFAFHPTQENAQSLATLFSVMGLLGTALGGHGKMSAMNSMQAMTGMMQGWRQGRQDLWNQEKAKFDEEFKQVQQIITNAKDDAQHAMQLLATDRDAYNAYIAQSKAKLGSQLANTILERQGPEKYMEYLNGLDKTIQEQSKQIWDKEKFHQEQQDKNREFNLRVAEYNRGNVETYESPEGLVEVNKVTGERRLLPGTKGLTKPSAKAQGEGPQLGPNAYLQNTLGVKAKDDKEAQKIVDNGIGLSTIDNTIKTFSDPDVRTGVAATLSKVKEQIKSISDDKTEFSDDQVNQLINGAIDPTDKNALAIKQAVFNAFAIEKAAQGGKVTVQMMRVGGNLLDPTKYTKSGYIALLNQRRGDLFRNLHGAGLNNDQAVKLVTDLAGPQPAYKSPNAKPMPTGEKLTDYAKAHFNGDEVKAKAYLQTQGYQ